jgi:adenosylhomocysteine nucleosidase
MKANTIGIIMATKIEAEPFIEGLGLELTGKQPVSLYGAGSLVLAISGIGKTAAAIATATLIERYRPSAVYNFGAAGAVNRELAVGAVFHIDRIIEPDRPRLMGDGPVVHTPDLLASFATASLATQDRPVIDEADRTMISTLADLVDMEGAAVAQACRAFSRPVYLFKIVSDTHGFGKEEIIASMIETRNRMYEFFRDRIVPGL